MALAQVGPGRVRMARLQGRLPTPPRAAQVSQERLHAGRSSHLFKHVDAHAHVTSAAARAALGWAPLRLLAGAPPPPLPALKPATATWWCWCAVGVLLCCSEGRINKSGQLECGYHGWAFGGSGVCLAIPQVRACAAVQPPVLL